MDLKDILGLSKPLVKLIDVVERGVGRLSKSYFDRKDIETKVYEIEQLTEARAESIKAIISAVNQTDLAGKVEHNDKVLKISINKTKEAKTDKNLSKRADTRIKYQHAKAQLNIENVVSFATQELMEDEVVSEQPVNDDRIRRFFKIVEDISVDEMQALWGKILAGEIKKPDSFSLRTLETVKNISKTEAEVFSLIANYAVKDQSNNFLLVRSDVSARKTYELPFEKLAILKEIGILTYSDLMITEFKPVKKSVRNPYIFGKKIIVIERDEHSPLIQIEVAAFTKVGAELLGLIDKKAPEDYIRFFAEISKKGNVSVWEGEFERIDENGRYHHSVLQPYQF